MGLSIDREKVTREFELFIKEFHPACTSEGVELDMFREVLAMLKEQEAEKEALASLASLADHRRERVGKVLYDLCELGYPHNFQHEAPWVVDYLYELTAIIKRAYEVKNNDNT